VAKDFAGLPAWIVKAVGGTTTHWAGASLRFQDHEFKALTTYGEDRRREPARLADRRLAEMEPWYAKAETKLGVTRTNGIARACRATTTSRSSRRAPQAWLQGSPHRQHGDQLGRYDDRMACQQTGFCFQGCKWGAKWSSAYTDIPRGEATGNLEVRDRCHVARIEHDEAGKVTGVVYFDKDGALQMQKARIVCVAGQLDRSPGCCSTRPRRCSRTGWPIPRGMVGQELHASHHRLGLRDLRQAGAACGAAPPWPASCRTRRGTTPRAASSAATNWRRLSLGLPFMAAFLNPGGWGRASPRRWITTRTWPGMWIVGEDMPQDEPASPCPRRRTSTACRSPNVNFDDHPNDIAMRNHAYKQGIAMYEAVGATRAFPTPPYPSTHNLGTNRMAEAKDGVVNKWGQTHDIANLFVSDGIAVHHRGAENPTLTIVALAIRQADHIASEMSAGTI
jgi:choline dehydrogenase-like flavoprotein